MKKKRDVCPNSGFTAQLQLYEHMNFTLDANNLEFRRLLMECHMNPDSLSLGSHWSSKRDNPIKTYFSKRDLAENMTEKLAIGNDYLCANCGFKLFNEIHVIKNSVLADQVSDPKKTCTFTYMEPQKWMEYLSQEFEMMNETIIKCQQCKQGVIEFKKYFLSYMCGCALHESIGRCLRFRIADNKFKVRSLDQK